MVSRLEIRLTESLVRVCKGHGLAEDNLYKRLGPDLRKEFGVEKGDSPEIVRRKATRRLEQLIGRLREVENQRIARYSFNIGDPDLSGEKLAKRRDALHDIGGPAPKTTYDRMNKKVIPDLVRMIIADRRQG